MDIKQTFWECMIAADNLNHKLGELASHVGENSELYEDIIAIIIKVQDVRAECGVRTE
jgi:hypothetical protein